MYRDQIPRFCGGKNQIREKVDPDPEEVVLPPSTHGRLRRASKPWPVHGLGSQRLELGMGRVRGSGAQGGDRMEPPRLQSPTVVCLQSASPTRGDEERIRRWEAAVEDVPCTLWRPIELRGVHVQVGFCKTYQHESPTPLDSRDKPGTRKPRRNFRVVATT